MPEKVTSEKNRRTAAITLEPNGYNCIPFEEGRPEFGSDASQVFLRAARRTQGARRPESGAQRTAEPGPSCRAALLRVPVRACLAQQVQVLPHPEAVATDVGE